MLWEPGDRGGKVFFPQSGVVSICVPTRDGECIEVASIGREGAAGLNDGLLPAVTKAVIQAPGRFIGISAHPFAAAVHQSAELARMAALCNGWLLLQAQQIAACNAVHPADARFCRWLLRACDALGVEMISVTQESIARALGIRRTTVTLIAQQFQARGVISYQRGKIDIHDRDALHAVACDCYRGLGRARWPSELLATGGACCQSYHPAAG